MTVSRGKAILCWIFFQVLLSLVFFVCLDWDGTLAWMYNSRQPKLIPLKNETQPCKPVPDSVHQREKSANEELKGVKLTTSFDAGTEWKLPTLSPWSAPIIWDKTLNRGVLDDYYQNHTVTVGLTVFATGKYLMKYLLNFLRTADTFFLPGHEVIFYVMVDNLSLVPRVELGPQRQLRAFRVKRHRRWQDASMARMKVIGELVERRVGREVDFLFCMDVDQVFKQPYGAEVLGESVAQLHAWFYQKGRKDFPYERDPHSAAYIPHGEGDYYYHGAVFGGTPARVLNLTRECYQGIQRDKAQGLEAIWHDESHLNKYYLAHKPTKLLSPEYCWDYVLGTPKEIHSVKLAWMPKEYDQVRDKD